jgi:endoglucanase
MNRRETLLGAVALASCGPAGGQAPAPPFPMRRGVNLGNALEAPNEGDWGYRIEDAHLGAIADAGFDGVRLPVRWDAHADARGKIAPAFMERVAHIVDTALARGLIAQLDGHHYQELYDRPDAQLERSMRMWIDICEHFKDAPVDKFLFEPMNEPNGDAMNPGRLNDLQDNADSASFAANRERIVVHGPPNWNNIDALNGWDPPRPYERVPAVTVHYYEPRAFTHQGAEWLGADAPTFDRDWGTTADRRQVREHIAAAARWGRTHGAMMQLGEFGVNRAVPVQQRAMWTRAVREACEAEGMGWCVWDFAGAFPIWDRERGAFIPLMRDALFS